MEEGERKKVEKEERKVAKRVKEKKVEEGERKKLKEEKRKK